MIESHAYLEKGVSSGKTNLKQVTQGLEKGLFPHTFCNILPDILGNDKEHGVIIHSDGVGTKAVLAYLYWKETGDLSVFKNLALDALTMNLDDMACSGVIDQVVFTNTIGRNRFLIPDEALKSIINGYLEFIETLSDYGIIVKMGGGETADMGDAVRTLTIDACATSRIKLSNVIDFASLQAGSVIIGLSSSGQCSWEQQYNSGIGCNGLTMARHDTLSPFYAENFPESFSPEIPHHLAYAGRHRLTTPLPETQMSIGQALLSPTRTYLPIIRNILTELPGVVQGMIHCTGGGQTKCMKFGKGIHFIKDNLFDPPPLFSFLQREKSYKLADLYPVYNMGHRMEIFVDETYAPTIIEIAKSFQVDAKIIGYCEKSDTEKNQLTINTGKETIKY